MGAPRERAQHGLSFNKAKNGSGAAKKTPVQATLDRIVQAIDGDASPEQVAQIRESIGRVL